MSIAPVINDNDANGRQILEIIFESILDEVRPEFFNFVRDTYDMNNTVFVTSTKKKLKKALLQTVTANYILEACDGIDMVKMLEDDYRQSQEV